MRYRIKTVLLIVMVIAIGFQISFVSTASIVEWKADYNDWSQEEQEPITTVNTEGQVAIKETLHITNSQHMIVDGSDSQAKNDLQEQRGVGSSGIDTYVHHVFLPLVIRECTVVLSPGLVRYDGSDLAPGSVICLEAGTYSRLEFRNLKGTAAEPITIRNHGGLVYMNNVDNENHLRNCQHVHLTGTGVAGLEYGIKLKRRILAKDFIKGLEIDHLEFCCSKTVAMLICNGSDDWELTDLYIHHNYVHDLAWWAEGFYIGSAGYDENPGEELLRRVEIAYNTFDTVAEPIQVRRCVEDCKIHHNYIENAVPMMEGPTRGAINIGPGATAEVYNNEIRGSDGVGIYVPDTYFSHSIYNNLIVDSGRVLSGLWANAIYCAGSDNMIYNNTIIAAAGYGIWFNDWTTGCFAFNNIILDTVEASIRQGGNPDENFHHNLTKDDGHRPTNFGFVDLASTDYHLIKDSPAVDAGASDGAPRVDLDGRPRPMGVGYDVGAYEFVED